jgi:hypothetical protein
VRKWSLNFAYEVSVSYTSGFITCRKNERHGTDGFSSPPEEDELRTFIAFKKPLSSARKHAATRPPRATFWHTFAKGGLI